MYPALMRIVCAIFLIAILSSCKKNYNCACRTVFNYPGGSEIIESSQKPLEKRLTKKQAKAICDSEAAALEKTFNNWWTNNGAWQSGGVYARSSCIVE
jgi:hypothetical protein